MLLFVEGFVGKRFHHAAEKVPKTRKREQVRQAQKRDPLDPLGHPYIGKGRDVVICLRPTREYKIYT